MKRSKNTILQDASRAKVETRSEHLTSVSEKVVTISRRKKPRALKATYIWHRRIGVLIALPILVLTFTGILLSHTASLGLDGRFVSNPLLLSWYGMTPSTSPVAVSAASLRLVLFEESLYVNGKYRAEATTPPTGAGVLDGMLVVATEDSVYLFEQESGLLIEKLGKEALPGGLITAAAVRDGHLLLDTMEGTYSASNDVAAFQKVPRARLEILQRGALTTEESESLLEDWRGRGVTLARLTRDIHSGHFFGPLGVLLTDFSAAALGLLVLSGLYLWRSRTAR